MQATSKHGWNLIKDLDTTMDHSAVSKRMWTKDLHPDA